jgi:hypothetical protein
MKKSYINPEIIVMAYNRPSIQLLAGSMGANDQRDPNMAPLLDEELEDSYEYDTEFLSELESEYPV